MVADTAGAVGLMRRLEPILSKRIESAFGEVVEIEGLVLKVAGLSGLARIGDEVEIEAGRGRTVRAEIVSMSGPMVACFAQERVAGVSVGARARLQKRRGARPSPGWIGEIVDAEGNLGDGRPAPQGDEERPLDSPAPAAARRRRMGARVRTGLCAFDAFLPLCKGQRIGVFAGPGVGKSMLLGALARSIEADVAVIALIGERGREVRAFVEDVLGPEGRKRAIVIATTSDQPALVKKRGAQLAMTTAEFFRDRGKHVLLVFDSLTRYADAHREVALAAGEHPSLHAYPPTTFRAIAELVERSGPGAEGTGDITAVYSVLVAGSDMNEPVADIVRGVLDGHVVLERSIAERGRFPAIDLRRSVSRALPGAASPAENALIQRARALLGAYEDAEVIVRAGLYAPGSDPKVDDALKVFPELDRFLTETASGPEESFQRLEKILKLAAQ
jgi:flagellum-specific ATP synthase